MTDIASLIQGIVEETIWSKPFHVNRELRIAEADNHKDPLPQTGGIYRLGLTGTPFPLYVGQTKNLRRRINELRYAEDPEMPFTDPHIAGPGLWAWRQIAPEQAPLASYAETSCSAYWRQGLEDLVIAHIRWKQKREGTGRGPYSPLLNYHRLPDGWISSSEKAVGVRGGACEGVYYVPSIAPISDLDDTRPPIDEAWGNHTWSPWMAPSKVLLPPKSQGLYRIRARDSGLLLFLGYGLLKDGARKAVRVQKTVIAWKDAEVSYVVGHWTWTHKVQMELLTDLIGLYLCKTHALPDIQYGGEENEQAGSALPAILHLPQLQRTIRRWFFPQSPLYIPQRDQLLAVG